MVVGCKEMALSRRRVNKTGVNSTRALFSASPLLTCVLLVESNLTLGVIQRRAGKASHLPHLPSQPPHHRRHASHSTLYKPTGTHTDNHHHTQSISKSRAPRRPGTTGARPNRLAPPRPPLRASHLLALAPTAAHAPRRAAPAAAGALRDVRQRVPAVAAQAQAQARLPGAPQEQGRAQDARAAKGARQAIHLALSCTCTCEYVL